MQSEDVTGYGVSESPVAQSASLYPSSILFPLLENSSLAERVPLR